MVKGPVKTKMEKNEAAWERFAALDHATHLLGLHFFRHLHAGLGNSSLYFLDCDRHLERSGMKQLQFTASAPLFVLAWHSHEVLKSLH